MNRITWKVFMWCAEIAHKNKRNWIDRFNKYTCSIEMQNASEVNTLFDIKHAMNELDDPVMSSANLYDWYSHINQYDAPSGMVEINCGHTDFLNMNFLLSHMLRRVTLGPIDQH